MQKSSDSFECRIGICASESWQLEIAAFLEGGLLHGGKDREPSLLRRHPYPKGATVLYRDCFATAQRDLGWFLPCSSCTPWRIPLFGYIKQEKTQTQTKRRTQSTRTQNRIVLLCFAFSVTQIAAIISLAFQAFSFILKAVFGITLHLTQFNK